MDEIYTVRPEDEWTEEATEVAQRIGSLLNTLSGEPVELVPYVKCTDGIYRPEARTEQMWPNELGI